MDSTSGGSITPRILQRPYAYDAIGDRIFMHVEYPDTASVLHGMSGTHKLLMTSSGSSMMRTRSCTILFADRAGRWETRKWRP